MKIGENLNYLKFVANIRDLEGNTLLHKLASISSASPLIELLLARGPEKNESWV
ncbi:MAG: hypothetical protein WCF65_07795 [Parachlamydiaceae bacterium]